MKFTVVEYYCPNCNNEELEYITDKDYKIGLDKCPICGNFMSWRIRDNEEI